MKMGPWVKRIANKVGYTASEMHSKPITTALNTADEAIGGVAEVIGGKILGNATYYAGKGLKKGLTKNVDKEFKNFYTGIEMRKGSGWALAAGGIGVGYAGYAVSTTAPKPGTVSYGGEAPVFAGDGISSTTNAPTLNASGNMVFGLHNARKG